MNELAIGNTLVAAMSLVAISSASAAPPTKTSTTSNGAIGRRYQR